MLSDKLFYWLFQSRPGRILNLLDAQLADAGGYRFSAPALKKRPELPALILEAQMGPDPGFLRRLYAESARLLQQEPSIYAWQVVAEFLACRVQWVELLPERWRAGASKFHRLLALLVRSEAASPSVDSAELLTLIPTILLKRFNDRPLQEICTMTGLTVEDFTQSVAYREIFGLGKAREAAKMTIR